MTQENTNNIPLGMDEPTDETRFLPKARRDVEFTEQVYFGKPCFVLKDPTSLRYYRLRPPEYTIYKMLDAKTGMEDVLRVLAERFPNEQFDAQAVMSFVIMLRGANLLLISSDTSTEYLLKRKEQLSRGFFKKIRTEFLFYRIPMLDPDKLLNFLYTHLGRLIFSRFTAVLFVLLLAGAMALLIGNFDKLSQRQPILDPFNLLLMAIALFLIKIPHEIGHGLTSKHFGSEVHEMGILFLVFMPCMYCDVSDAWMISEKKRRMWITAAGVVVEFFLAALATYIWALTESKTVINQFALNIMIVASVNSLLFNGNPLLRYDGYYFMMDLIEIPNLKQKGSSYLWYLLQRFVLGVDNADEPIDARGRELTLLGYAICSAVYRWFIMIAIVTMVWKFLDPYGWGVVGGFMAMGCIYTSFAIPIFKFIKYIFTQRHQIHIRIATAVVLVLLAGGAVYGLLLLPVEQDVNTQCVLRPARTHSIYVTQPGFIDASFNETFIRDGQAVEAGQVLLVLSDEQLEYHIADLDLRIRQLRMQRDQARQLGRRAAEAEIEAKINGLNSRYDRAEHNLKQLTIRSPITGVVQLRTVEPLENLDGAFLSLQTQLFVVYRPGDFEAVAAINHRDNGFIEPDQIAEIKLWALDGEVFQTHVVDKPPAPVLKMFSPVFSTIFNGDVPTMPATNKEEALEPAENTYELILPISTPDPRLRDGMVGRCRIIIEKRTLAKTVYLWLIRTLRQEIRL